MQPTAPSPALIGMTRPRADPADPDVAPIVLTKCEMLHCVSTVDPHELREQFEGKVSDLVGRCVTSVDYWDIHHFGTDPARWDYGDWHHAVMGVQLNTDRDPVTVIWTNTFYPYGVEVFHGPIEDHLVLREDGPERVGPDADNAWACILGKPIRATKVWWDRLELGPALIEERVVEEARSVDVPTALRLDFDAGSVWFVAGIPQGPLMEEVFLPGDEIMVIFTAEKMLWAGFQDPSFASA
jgi:hypothetical protein